MALAAFVRPFSIRALPGLLLTAFPIIEFFAMGYKMACASTAMRNIPELPKWQNWRGLFLFGLMARILQAIWLLPAATIFLLLWFRLRTFSIETLATLPQLLAIKDLFTFFLVFLVLAAIFAPASILNYVAEGRFTAAFSFSVIRRMASKAYVLGWLAAGIYTVIVGIILFAVILMLGNLVQALSGFQIALLLLLTGIFLLWFSGITIWTLLGEAWGKAMQREYAAAEITRSQQLR